MLELIKNLLKQLKPDLNISQITEETDLIDEIGLDSLETIQFILGLEDDCDVEIDFDSFEFDLLHRVGDLVQYLKKSEQQ